MIRHRLTRLALSACVFGVFASGSASAKDYFLKAERVEIPVQDVDANGAPVTVMVPMWGYAQCAAKDPNQCGTATVPGPEITVKENENLSVFVYNDLKTSAGDHVELDAGRTSFTVAGLRLRLNYGPIFWGPSKFDPAGDPDQPRRVRSMTQEARPGQWQRYSWLWKQGDLKPGTYIYHSATHPAVQVQMGLYGPMTVLPAAASEVYHGVSVDAAVDIFYSEIDAAFHADVDKGLDGYNPIPQPGNPAGARTSPLVYSPTYYLVNGKPQVDGVFAPTWDDPASGGVTGAFYDRKTLVRFRSAALRSRIPMTTGATAFDVIAETAEPYYAPPGQEVTVAARRQNAILLPALTTKDAIVQGGKEGATLIVDRALGETNAGGMNTFLVLPDKLQVYPPVCTPAGNLIARVRTNSSLGDQQVINFKISNGTPADDLIINNVPAQAQFAGKWQYRSILVNSPFCAPGTVVTLSAMSGSGGFHSDTVTIE
ncbi:hypothetical protein [Hyphomonas sp.]|uniref:hypothetical protein n=1 Tax=Hyphomonas sp. TaxID=87 RepID=UPI003526EB66